MLKDVSRITDKSPQENWSAAAKRRRKKASQNGVIKPAEDKLDLSDPARFLASFKNVDFKHWTTGDLLCFRLTATGSRYLFIFEGDLNTNNSNWQVTWTVESKIDNVAEHEILNHFYQMLTTLVSDKNTKMEYLLNGEELTDFLDDSSRPVHAMLKDLLTFVQNLLPIAPAPKNTYSQNIGYEITAGLSTPIWPLYFKRHKASGILLKWTKKSQANLTP